MALRHSEKTVAAIDLGSQTFRLALVRILGDRFRVLASEPRNVRLGQGLAASGRLSEDAVNRGIETLEDFRRVLDMYGTGDMRVCGTAALRCAANAEEFLALAAARGFHVEILSGEEEACISAKGVYFTLPDISRPFLIVDVGGGSCEIVKAGKNGMLFNRSLDMGAVNLTEEFLRTDPPISEEVVSVISCIRQKLSGLSAGLLRPPGVVVGVGGTATTLAAIMLGMKEYDPRRIRGHTLSSQDLNRLWISLRGMKIQERRCIPGLESRRADIILAGIAIFQQLLHVLGFSKMIVSDGGLLLGLMVGLIEKESDKYAKSPNTQGLYL